jgi:hypothetical protein
MNDPRKYPKEIQECWSIHQVFRALGFPPENIYVMLAQDGACPYKNSSLFVVLKEGSREFTITLANYQTEEEAKKRMAAWSAFVDQANAQEFDQEILDKIFHSSNIMRDKLELLLALQKKGFGIGGGLN